jgi:hypothetical protein
MPATRHSTTPCPSPKCGASIICYHDSNARHIRCPSCDALLVVEDGAVRIAPPPQPRIIPPPRPTEPAPSPPCSRPASRAPFVTAIVGVTVVSVLALTATTIYWTVVTVRDSGSGGTERPALGLDDFVVTGEREVEREPPRGLSKRLPAQPPGLRDPTNAETETPGEAGSMLDPSPRNQAPPPSTLSPVADEDEKTTLLPEKATATTQAGKSTPADLSNNAPRRD